jgi:dolichol-phosphate mannosyltransferase
MNRAFITEFLKYALIGFSGIFVNLLFLYFLTDVAGIYYLVSSVFSFSIATTWNYFFNKIWTFKENLKEEFGEKYFKFFVVSLFALGVNTLGMYFFTEIVGFYYLFSQVLTAGFTLIVNFSGNKFWTFRK